MVSGSPVDGAMPPHDLSNLPKIIAETAPEARLAKVLT
jgi:hypothetical protein